MEVDLIDIVTGVVGIAGLAFGLFQYSEAPRWKRSEFAANLVQQLSTDADLELCCIFLDWKTLSIAVPEKYRIFTGAAQFTHTWDDLKKALRPSTGDSVFQFPQVLYRDAFDKFFSYLDRIDHYLNIGLFEIKDVEPLRYWIEELRNSRYLESRGVSAANNPFLGFIETYHHNSVKDLMLKFALTTKGRRLG